MWSSAADVLDLSVGEPLEADSVDLGGGVIVRVDDRNRLVGLTLLHLGRRSAELEATS